LGLLKEKKSTVVHATKSAFAPELSVVFASKEIEARQNQLGITGFSSHDVCSVDGNVMFLD